MKKTIQHLFLILIIIFMSACEAEEGNNSAATTVKGWHFQGRDCLACHNVDLNENKHLIVGGTLYKSSNISNEDDLNNVCGGNLVVKFLDANFNTVYSSKDYEDVNSKGYKAKGNLFILSRTHFPLSAETFHVQIEDKNGTVFAVSNFTHNFTTDDYDINNRQNRSNRISCNACHIKGGFTSVLYAQLHQNQCK